MAADSDVVIVGAGAAGVAAARRLAGSGLSVVVVEAAARVGGRAWTLEIAGLPLDLGCEWLHSATRNSWARVAEDTGFAVNRRPPTWDRQFRDLGFPQADQEAADAAFGAWRERIERTPPASDRASDALEPGGRWNGYIDAISGYLNGVGTDQVSVADYLAYDEASTGGNWRIPRGYGSLVAASLPARVALRVATPVERIDLAGRGVRLTTPAGDIDARAAIVTVATNVLAGDSIRLPPALDLWREAATRLPLGRNEKVFLEIVGEGPFEPDTHVMGAPGEAHGGAYMIRPLGWPVIEGFFGGASAEIVERDGPAAGFAHATDELAALFGSSIRPLLRPLVATAWGRATRIGGAYSHALPGFASARADLARPFDGRLFFAGEATDPRDYSTAHGAYASGVRAAEEALATLGAGRPSTPPPTKVGEGDA